MDKSFVGKYVCYAADDGSFTFGRIEDQGWVRTVKGEREVFVLTNQIVCRVARSELELETIGRIRNRIEAKREPLFLPSDPPAILDYKRFGDRRLLPEKQEASLVPTVKTGESLVCSPDRSVVPKLDIGMVKSQGLPMMQKVGVVHSSVDGHPINFVLRRFGYNTIVHRNSLNEGSDIIDPDRDEFKDMTDGEVFLLSMREKLKGASTQGIIGQPKGLLKS